MLRSGIVRKLAIALGAGAATLAMFSADRADAQQPVHDWSGFYVGGQVGFAGGEDHFDFGPNVFVNTVHPDGVLGGAHIGYNWQSPENFVLGLVGDVNFGDVDGSNTKNATTNSLDMDIAASARLKFGYAWDNWLFFGTAGLAIAELEFTNQFGNSPTYSRKHTEIGFTAGGGFEVAFNDYISGLLEYRYTTYDSETQSAITIGNFNFAQFSHQLDTHQIQAGISINLTKLINAGP